MGGAFTPTRPQADALRFIAGYQEATGISPSYAEIKRALGMTSQGQIQRLLGGLEERGHIRRLFNRVRAIEVLHKPTIPRAPSGEPLHFVRVA